MTGADVCVEILLVPDPDTVFANAGISEMHFVVAFDGVVGSVSHWVARVADCDSIAACGAGTVCEAFETCPDGQADPARRQSLKRSQHAPSGRRPAGAPGPA